MDVQAAVIEWQGNIVIPANIDGLYIKIDTQQTLAGAGSGLPGWDLNPFGSSSLAFFSNSSEPQNGTMRFPGVVSGPAGSLTSGTEIGPSGSFDRTVNDLVFGSNPGNWSLNAVNYIGFRFTINPAGTVHYGWGSVQVGATVTDRRILSFAYETTPNTPILASSLTSIPESSTVAAGALAGLAVGARFVIQRRRRASQKTADCVGA